MSRALIIGYGNPLRSDDGVGWAVAERLQRSFGEMPSVEILAVHQLTPELAEAVSRAELVVFVDAAFGGGLPGTWKCEPVNPDEVRAGPLGHHFTPAELLVYARALFASAPQAVIVSVVGGSFEAGGGLSPAVDAVLGDVERHLFEVLERLA